MPFSSEEPPVYPDKAQAERAFETSRERSLVDMSLQELLTAARDEREGLKYQQTIGGYTERIEYGGSSIGNEEEVYTPKESVTRVLKGDSSRYREICEVIATKLIHMDEKDENLKSFNKINVEDDTPALVQTKQHVDKILQDKHEKSIHDVMALYKDSRHKGGIKQGLVTPLMMVLGCASSSVVEEVKTSKISPEEILNQLRNYKDKLLDSKKGASIAEQLKATGNLPIVKILEGMLFTLLTLGGYGIYAIKQATTGGSFAGIDNIAEQVAKNAERRLYPERYQSIHHVTGGQQAPENKPETPTSPQSPHKP